MVMLGLCSSNKYYNVTSNFDIYLAHHAYMHVGFLCSMHEHSLQGVWIFGCDIHCAQIFAYTLCTNFCIVTSSHHRCSLLFLHPLCTKCTDHTIFVITQMCPPIQKHNPNILGLMVKYINYFFISLLYLACFLSFK